MNVLPFPRLKFADENDLLTQFEHMFSEVREVAVELDALMNSDVNVEAAAMEIGDVMTSCHTMLCIIQRLYDIHPLDVMLRVAEKNQARDYNAEGRDVK